MDIGEALAACYEQGRYPKIQGIAHETLSDARRAVLRLPAGEYGHLARHLEELLGHVYRVRDEFNRALWAWMLPASEIAKSHAH